MRLIYALLFLICVWLPASVSAEYYKYRDQNGVLRFTDNLADIPEDQRLQIESHTEIEYSTAVEQGLPSDPEDTHKSKKVETKEGGQSSQVEKLNQTKAALDREHAKQIKEKQALEQYKETQKDQSEAEARVNYQERVTSLNQKIAAYERRRQAFKRRADAFNAQVE